MLRDWLLRNQPIRAFQTGQNDPTKRLRHFFLLYLSGLVTGMALAMKIIALIIKGLYLSLLLASGWANQVLATTPPLQACVAQIAGLSFNNDEADGILIDILKRLDDFYEGDININSYPFARSINTATQGKCDFHVPFIQSPSSELNFNSKPLTRVAFVIYRKALLPGTSASTEIGPFDTIRGHGRFFNFNTVEVNTEIQGLRRLLKNRSNAFIYAQEPVDSTIAREKLHGLFSKELLGYFPSGIVLPDNEEHANRIDTILTPLLLEAEKHPDYRFMLLEMHSDFSL